MAAPQQPPPDGWQPPPPPRDGHQSACTGTGSPPDVPAHIGQPGGPNPVAGHAEPVLTAGMIPGRRRRWIVSTVLLLVAAGGLFIQHVVTSQMKGHLVLPGTLLGLPKYTSSAARHAGETLKNREMQGASGKLKGVVAAVYGSPTGHLVALTGGGLCGTCMPDPASQLKSDLIAQGYPDARLFPAGPKGGAMACGTHSTLVASAIRCSWVDNETAGDILYLGGSAKGLDDAAAQSLTVRSVVEH
ncbi:MAG: hypothetical protein ACTHKL_09540 [Streptosporangiaceae bacterium]